MPFRIPDPEWNEAKQEARALMIARAQQRGKITYADLAVQIAAVPFEAYDKRLFRLLGDISRDEVSEGRGMLSAVVVHKTGDMEPGEGFFDLAKQLCRCTKEHGRGTMDRIQCWISELNRVHDHWAGEREREPLV